MKRYEILEHTADIGIKAYGRNLRELFSNAALGMFGIITDLDKVKPHKSVEIKAEAENEEELLVALLRELLYCYNSKEMLFKDFDIEDMDEKHIKVKVSGENIDRARHELKTEIKAVTYHELKIEKQNNRLTAQVIFDV